jgi:hypothetical protein
MSWNRYLWSGLLLLAVPLQAFAWGHRGHHVICEAAVYLVKDKAFKEFMMARPQLLGHLCNIPDIYWKNIGSEINELGRPTHHINPEVIGLKMQDVPADFKSIIAKYDGQTNQAKGNKANKIHSVPADLGSVWWRADQFFRRAIEDAKTIKTTKPPQNRHEEQEDQLPYNQATYAFVVDMGLMGHFVGDASQPFHSNADFDGYAQGHGGIHYYYEDLAVDAQPVDLVVKVEKRAEQLRQMLEQKGKKAPAFLSAANPIEKMRALSQISVADIERIFSIDPTIKASHLETLEGKEVKTAAERKPVSTVAAKYSPLLVEEMARGAALLSRLWDDAYEAAGKPDLSKYRSYKYPFTPEFVPPDYFDVPKAK